MVTCSCNDLTSRVVLRGDTLSHVFIRNPTDVTTIIHSISVGGEPQASDLNIEIKGNAMNKVDLLPYSVSIESTVILTFSDGNQLVIHQ